MLIAIRKKASGWVAWLIVAIIAVPFALFGINSYFEGVNQVNVASVAGEKISLDEFRRSMDIQRRSMQQQFGANFDPGMIDNPVLRKQVLEGIVANRLLQKYSSDKGLRLDDASLAEQISNSPNFQVDGAFSEEQYRRYLSSSGYTPEGYEHTLRTNGALRQLQLGIAETGFVSDQELDQQLALSLQTRDADYMTIQAADYLDQVEVSEAEIQAHYDNHLDDYQEPEKIRLDYITLDPGVYADGFEVSDEAALAAYEANTAAYLRPEARKASHILFAVPRNADEEKDAEIKAKAETILAEINAGEDFAKLAEEHSEDPGSSRNGGDLGLISAGQMVAPFEEAVFDMSDGEVRGPVKTQFGYHLIKLTSLSPEAQKPFEEVKEQVISAEQRRLADEQFEELGETFRTLVFENPESLQTVADEMDLEVTTSDWLARNQISSTLAIPRAAGIAFSDEVMQQELNSEVIEGSKGELYALRKNDYQAAEPKPFDTVKDNIRTILETEKVGVLTQVAGDAVIAKLDAGEPIDEELSASRKTLSGKQTDIKGSERLVGNAVFSASQPEGDQPTVGGVSLNNGDYAIYSVNSVSLADPAEVTEQERAGAREALLRREGFGSYMALRQLIRNNADVDVFDSVLNNDLDP